MGRVEADKKRRLRLRLKPSALRTRYPLPATVLWLIPALVVTLLVLRFGLRLVGVRYDVPLAGGLYSVTRPIVEPFYRWFPAPERFDYYAVEWASLVAAGAVVGVALLVYVAGLLLVTGVRRRRIT